MKKQLFGSKVLQCGPPTSVVLATCVDGDGNPNIITLGMFMYISSNPPLVCIGVAEPRYSHKLILEQGEFAINTPTVEIVEEMHKCGITSGRDGDKFKKTGLTPIPAQKIKSPLIKECYGHLECKVWSHYECGDHTLIVGEVVASSINENVLDEKDNQVLTKANPVIQKNWSYHIVKKI
ncbi:MAG: flavin reductase family protein [Candidatus Bathyarchaeota archaeon]|nr:flavin reductase family protein [Candidatus Bathyarchaeota archaeon]